MPERTASPCSVMVFTYQEEVNLPHCLASLGWCDDVIVIDSFSTDRTCEIATAHGARVLQHRFGGFGTQRNWALEHAAPRHDWVLILDADESVPRALAEELGAVLAAAPPQVAAFRVCRRFHMWGRWLRYSSFYPTYVVRLIRRGRVRYVNRGHAETQTVDGEIHVLTEDLVDENRKGLHEWFQRQNSYSSREAEHEAGLERAPWRVSDAVSKDPMIRRALAKRVAATLPGRPLWYFLYAYFVRGGFIEGADGLNFCLMKASYQAMIAMKKIELRSNARRA